MDMLQKIYTVSTFYQYARRLERAGLDESSIAEIICGCKDLAVLESLYELSLGIREMFLSKLANALSMAGKAEDDIGYVLKLSPSTVNMFLHRDIAHSCEVVETFYEYGRRILKFDTYDHNIEKFGDVLDEAVNSTKRIKEYVVKEGLEGDLQ